MSEMRTQTKGRKFRRIAAVALILAVLLGVVAAVSASAAEGLFKIEVYDNTTTDDNGAWTGAVVKGDKTAVDGKSNFSNGVSVNLKTDQIFTVKDYSDLSHVNRLELTVSEKSSSVTVTVATSNNGWKSSTSNLWGTTKKYYYAPSSGGIDKTTFDNLMNSVTVKCSKSSSTSAASVKLTLEGGATDEQIADKNRLGLVENMSKGTTYTEVLTFFTYATATVDLDSVKVKFANQASDETTENPDVSKRGSVSFDMLVTNVGDGSFLRLGYQIKEATDTWDTKTTELHDISNSKYRYDRSKGTGKNQTSYPLYSTLGTVNSSTGVVSDPKPVTITVTGLDPEKEYDIRGVVVTDSDTAAYTKALNVPRVKYTQPVISTLNIGNTAPQQGGTEKEITAVMEFNNRNYDSLEDGPRLLMQLYFTKNRISDEGVDKSEWTKVGSQQSKLFEKNEDGSYKTNLSFEVRHRLPEEDATNCAYKLVVTDANANGNEKDDNGYYVTKYSDATFVLDQNPPTEPTITAGDLTSEKLKDGSAVVGGANSSVSMRISGSTDAGSGVKEYSYEMYYLETDSVNKFITEQKELESDATNQQILQAMAKLEGADPQKVYEYTPSTSLVLAEDGSSTLAISKDGFYAVKVTAVDNVGKTSDPTIAIFRVDLTPPSAPVIALAAQVSNDEVIENSGATPIDSSKFRKYDNRTYTSDTVWVFVRTDAQAGKTVDPSKYQFSINGGLVWRSIDSARNFKTPTATAAYTTVGGTVEIYNNNYSDTETFTYDAAFQLSCNDISGFQTVVVRAVDNLGNTSLPSGGQSMRTTEIIRPIGEIKHEGIEVAMAMGNTSLEVTASIVQDLRNDVALKINERYFGTNHGSGGSAATNPINLLYVGGKLHQCSWDSSNNSVCVDASCPYKTYANQYNLYTPSMVNMQDLASGERKADTNFDWVRFDHTNVISEVVGTQTIYYPTVVFDSGIISGNTSSPELHSTADTNIDPTKSTYLTTDGKTRYTAMSDYVVYLGQTTAITNATTTAGETNRIENVKKLTATASSNNETLAGQQAHQWLTNLGNDTHSAVGRYKSGSGASRPAASAIPQRIYHMVDMSDTVQTTVGTYGTAPTADLAKQGKWERIYALGYWYTSSKDWMFVYNGQSTRKEIYFTADDTDIFCHSNDGYGFLFNTTIRQNVAGEWVISGYLFGIGSTTTAQAERVPYYRYIFRLEDVRLDWFANSRITTLGKSFGTTADDFFMVLRQSMSTASGGKMTYGTQKITLLAYFDSGEGTTAQARNYVLVTDGASAEAYVWNASGKTSADCVQRFTDQMDDGTLDTNTNKTTGYTKIHWRNYNNSGPYSNDNPSTSLGVKGRDDVLYVPRPAADGYNIGDLSIFEDTDDPSTYPHSDSNCYGFGPITFARSTGHGCNNDTLVVFSNVTMRVTKGKTLADVITQPKWGTGKVKYILNVSDDSIQDLTDPIMSATVAWRIQNDSAKFISWGSLINRKVTQNFIDTKIEGNGKYIVSRVTGYDDQTVRSSSLNTNVTAPGQRSQSKQVADYIADTYYKSYGIDTAGSNAPEKVAEMLSGKGTVISAENAKLMTFSVTPENYNNGTANEDFPSGRWYITYDATGYAGHTSYARFSDALDLTLNKPGRYQVYFAPDMDLLGAKLRDPMDDLLNPDDDNCIFDLIVNEEAYAQPIATVDASNTITVNDFSIDPDNNVLINEYTDPQNQQLLYNNGQLLTGIVKTYWRWELAAPYTDPTTKEQQSIVLMKSGVTAVERGTDGTITSPYDGLTVADLTKQVGKLYTEPGYDAKTYIDKLKANNDNSLNYLTSGSTIYYDKVPEGATITVYEQVEDISTRRTLSNGKTKYVESGRTKSSEATANLIAASDADTAKPIRPASSLTLSTETMYDTANADSYITVTRSSFHGQKEPLTLQFNIIRSDDADQQEGTPLTSTDDGKNWYLGSQKVLEEVTAPSFNDTTGRTGGVWRVSKSTIQSLAKTVGGSFALKIKETVTSTEGHSGAWADGSTGPVYDSSSRAIYYSRDQRAPTMQTVTLETGTLTQISPDGEETWEWADYEASNYLDMTIAPGQVGAKKIRVTVSGSSDNEGRVAGYAYCFYIGSDQSKATYYYMKEDGTLQSTGTGANGAKAAINLSSGLGILRHDNVNQAIGEDDEFSFEIDANAMTLNNVPTVPLVSLNLAICAFDNQTGVTTGTTGSLTNVTGANETVRTKVENIKLAKFVPTVLAIDAVNTTGETISAIGNDEALKGGTDTQVTKIPVANTKVTISFTPRQDWFEISDDSGAVHQNPKRLREPEDSAKIKELEASGDPLGRYIKYFTDRTGEADLTNRVTVDYEIWHKAIGDTEFKKQSSGTDTAYTATLSVDTSGEYRVIAKAKNGSGVYSAEQTLTFSVDREAPTPAPIVTVYDEKLQPYKENTWVQGVTVSVRGSTDSDPVAYYQYSTDNGVKWTTTKETTHLNDFEFTITETGTHYLRVKATDTGGNESEAPMKTIMVDNTPPNVSPPNVSVNSESVTVFKEAIVTLGQTEGGTVYAWEKDENDEWGITNNQEVVIDPAGSAGEFIIVPDKGKRVFDIKLGTTAYSPDELAPFTDPDGVIEGGLVLTIPQVTGDGTLQVTFVDEAAGANYMAMARAASYNALQSLRIAAPELYADEDAPRPIAAMHDFDIDDDNPEATWTTSDKGSDVQSGDNVVLDIAVTEGYRVTKLVIHRTGTAEDKTVLASELEPTGVKNHYRYVVENVTTDVKVTIYSEQKTPATVTIDADGNGSILVDDEVTVQNRTYDYATYVDDTVVLKVQPATNYKLSSLKVDGVEKVSGAAVDTYSVPVTAATMKVEAKFTVASDVSGDISEVTVVINQTDGAIHGSVSPRGEVSTDGATGAEKHVISVFTNGNQTILLKPDPTYTPTNVRYVFGNDQTEITPNVNYDAATGYYSVELTGVKGKDGKNTLYVDFTGKQHKLKASTVAKEIGHDDVEDSGGIITYSIEGSTVKDTFLSEANVPEGSNVTVQITPESGYRIEKVTLNGQDMGKRRNLQIAYMKEETQIEVVFLKREFGEALTSHSMTVTAVGISDGQEALHDEPYSFRLNTDQWSAFQAGTSLTYTNLDPNTAYTVTVRAKDRRGNISSEETKDGVNAKTIYTLANVPAALDVEAADDTDNVLDKTVKISVNPMGNPADTEYCVYYSDRSDMRNRALADVEANGIKWGTLDGIGQITVYHLAPGTTYYLQVAARNKDNIATEANDQNVLEITLSPTAPPDNTFYFEDQSAPGESVKLVWSDPAGEVEGFYLYRDGTMIKELGKDDRTFTDSYSNLRGDGMYVYSYAYRNSAGVGARRTAVSKEYYDQVQAVAAAKEQGNQSAQASAEAKLKQMDDLKGTNYPNLYKELMTYPSFPSYFTKVYAMSTGITQYNGEMVLRIQTESSTTARAQRYKVGLHAYDMDGRLVADGTRYGDSNDKTWRSSDTEKYTTVTSSSGATVSWSGLNINWEYRVYVTEVTSTGWTTYDNSGNVSDGYQSGTAISAETALHKRYIVDSKGYSYEYGVSAANGVLKVPAKVSWNTTTADAYTTQANDTYTGWNEKGYIELVNRNVDGGDYIKFNKSPQIYIPKNGGNYDLDFLYGTDKEENTELTVYGNNRFLLVESSDDEMKVKLHVKVYDPDGPADGNLNYTVTGTLGGVTARTTIAPTAADIAAVGTDEDTATECVLEFDVKNLPTGVYDDLKLSVANGAIDVAFEDTGNLLRDSVSLVVNQSLPTISASNGGGTKKIENGRNYGKESKLIVSSNVSANNPVNLRKVRMILMEEQYKAAGLEGQFDSVLKETVSADNIAKIDAVQPPMTAYFQVEEDIYLLAQQQDPLKVLTTQPAADKTYYWVEKELALTNDWCDFLTRDASGDMTVHLKDGDELGTTYPVLMVAYFGQNQSSMNLRFQVMQAPSLTVETEQTWAWVQTTIKEVEAYQDKADEKHKGEPNPVWTIGDVYYEASEEHHALNEGTKTPEELGYRYEDPAVREETTSDGTEYYVFKLWDNKATIQSREVSSYIQVKTGMYSQINQAQIVMVPEVATDPSGDNEHAAPPASDSKPAGYTGELGIKVATVRYQGSQALRDNVRAYFTVSNLNSSTTYYMWVYYQVTDPESGSAVWYHTQDCLAMTTDSDYQVSTVGFEEASRSYEESEYDLTGHLELATLVRLGDYEASGVEVEVAAKYYKATQYGEYELDENGERIEITPDMPEYQWAKETVELLETHYEIKQRDTQTGVQYQVRNTDKMQGHMIVQLIEKVVANIGDGINRETTNANILEIFVLDDESPITSYKAGLDEVKDLILMETGDDHLTGKHYDYKFKGMPDPYGSADMSSLSLAIKNIGDGELNNIDAKLLSSDRVTPSTEFVFATPPTLTTLASPEEGVLAASERSLLTIVPAENLADGVHEGWLKITADRVKDADVIWVHLYQVVGQATLKGNIYIGEAKPETTTEHVGVATVKVYSSSASIGMNDPLYEVDTNDNGYFEIPNILVGKEYCIVVDRIGCATYNSSLRWTWTPMYSSPYRFDLQMVAGDINNDGKVNSADRTELEKYMNHTIAEAEAARDAALRAGDEALAAEYEELAEKIRRCDLDQNGGVNSIDRMLLWSNLNKGTTTGGVVVTLYRAVDPTRITG